MGKQTKNPVKLEKKNQRKDTLSEQYDKFNNIQYESSDDDIRKPSTHEPLKHSQKSNHDGVKSKLPIVNPTENLDYMIQNQIHSYMSNASGLNIGMGKPLTQKEYDEMRQQERSNRIPSNNPNETP